MKSRGLRAVLILAVVIGTIAAGYRVWRLDERRTADASTLQAIDDDTRQLLVSMADLTAAQRSYVVGGQGFDYWTSRVTALLADLDVRLQHLRGLTRSDPAHQALDTAQSVAGDFSKLDGTVRQHLRSDQRTLASDLIFTEAVQLITTASEQIEVAREAAMAEARAAIAQARREQAWWLAGVAALALMSLLLLAPLPGPLAASTAVTLPDTQDDPADLYLKSPRAESPVAHLNLTAAARLCSDLARVTDPAELTAIFERAATVLNARGLVLWLPDDSRTTLRPALWHGYPQEAFARVASMPCDADNATAAAFREAKMMTVPGQGSSYGAIVAPVISANGCLGALAIEVPMGVEHEEHARALATIFAAQLSGLIASSVPPATNAIQAQA